MNTNTADKQHLAFYALELRVNNLDESLYFYERMGFEVGTIDDTDDYVYAEIYLSEKSDFRIILREYFNKAEAEDFPKTIISLFPNEKEGITHRMAYDKLLQVGLRFINLPCGEVSGTILSIGEISDPDGNRMELIDPEMGDE